MTSLLARNLPRRAGDETLRRWFGRFGEVVRVVFVFDRSPGGLRRFAFVDMADREAALRAQEGLDRRVIEGVRLRVEAYQPSHPAAAAEPGAEAQDPARHPVPDDGRRAAG
jgi:RNA recognition motif-containing protein